MPCELLPPTITLPHPEYLIENGAAMSIFTDPLFGNKNQAYQFIQFCH